LKINKPSNLGKHLFSFVLLIAAQRASGFEINPNSHNPDAIKRSLKTEYRTFLARLTRPTHEELTRMSLQCAASPNKLEWCGIMPITGEVKRHFAEDAAIHGTRWNDDPNNFFRVNNEVQWFFWLKAAAIKHNITTENPLEYRSHYGDLQFLHGMSRAETSPLDTRDNIGDWSRFAYDVASGQIAPSATLRELAPEYRFARFFTQTSKGQWTVKKLFTNVGDVLCKDDCPPDLAASDEEVAALALGALLHTIQDSLSDSHVERITENGASRVTAWLDYKKQDSGCHGEADKDTSWIEQKKFETKPAIAWGAWLAQNAMQGVLWKDIEVELKNRMFTLAQKHRVSDGGNFRKCHKKS
jgi:hypothetical protein